MPEVLLTHSYFMRFDRKQWKSMQPYAALATLYAASVLRNSGIDVALFDSMLAASEEQLSEAIRKNHPAIIAIYDDSFNYLTKMCLERMRMAAFRMIEISKTAGCFVAVSGSDAADHVKEYLDRGADYVIKWLRHGYFSMNVVTTRGCPFGCNWCAKPVYGRVYNSRSPKNVVDEITMLRERYDPEHIWFCDDIFGLKPGWLTEFAEEVRRARLEIRYKCLSRPDLLLMENNFECLARSGCETVWLGAESGSQKILDAMEKGTTVDEIRLATRRLKQERIKVGYFIQFGYPGESYDDIKKTLELVRDEAPDDIGISVSYPLPQTKFYNMVQHSLGIKQNWYDSNDLALLFPGEFRPSFYLALHKMVHSVHRLRRILSRAERLSLRTVAAFAFNAVMLIYSAIVLHIRRRRNPFRIDLTKNFPAEHEP